MVLGYIYEHLGEAASHPDHSCKANVIFPNHYVIGWLAELFPYLYHYCPNSDYPGDFPYLRLNMFSGMGDIILSELAFIVRTLVMAEM